MYCENCGAKLEDNAKFCQNCGEIVSSNYEETNGALKIPAGVFGIFGGLAILLGIIFGLMNYTDTKTQDAETYSTLPESNYAHQDAGQENNIDDIEIAPDNVFYEDEFTASASSEIVEDTSSDRVYDLIGVLNQEDKQRLEDQYIQTSKAWQCNFCIFYVGSVTEQNEDDLYHIIQQYTSTWENNMPGIIFIYDNSTGIVNTYSFNDSLDMMGEYTKDYIESETEGLIHCVPEDSLDFCNIGGLMIDAYYELHEKTGSNYRFTESDLDEIEIICKKSLAYSDYWLLLEGFSGLSILENHNINAFGLTDMDGNGLEELVVDISITTKTFNEEKGIYEYKDTGRWYYIFQWDNCEYVSWQEVPQGMSQLFIKEDNTLVAYWLEGYFAYPYHYVLEDNGIEQREDEAGIRFESEDEPYNIPYEELEMFSNTEDNRYNYLSTVLQR